ncbi:hypothetical protein [Haloechinothrix salitolerans]|uniref:Integral membrane protein n=1 Tax=Haloechinothrix salitolerans TaxID=926830 RepID=A0ABW2C6I3_9PSEU
MTSDSRTSTPSDDAATESEQATNQADSATDPATETASAPRSEAPADTDVDNNADAPVSGDEPATDAEGQVPVAARAGETGKSSGGFAAGAVAIVSAGLGLVSLTGSSLGDMLRFRKEIIGQIDLRSGGGGDQVEIAYGAPWDTVAIVNGVFALLAVVVGGALVAVHANNADTKGWVKAVALGGALLGVIGLGIAGGMYLDLFGSQPELPQAPQMPGAGG